MRSVKNLHDCTVPEFYKKITNFYHFNVNSPSKIVRGLNFVAIVFEFSHQFLARAKRVAVQQMFPTSRAENNLKRFPRWPST